MWPDEPFAPARGSFLKAVPVPTVDPTATPTISVTVACAWLPYIRGALQQLLLQATWDTSNSATLLLAQQRAFSLIDLFRECSEEIPVSCPYDFRVAGGTGGSFAVVPESAYTPGFFGAFAEFSGWLLTVSHRPDTALYQTRLEITRHFPTPVNMNAIEMTYSFVPGAFEFDPGNANLIVARSGGTVIGSAVINPRTLGSGTFFLGTTFAAHTITDIDITIVAGEQHGSDAGGGGALLDWGYNVPGGGCGF